MSAVLQGLSVFDRSLRRRQAGDPLLHKDQGRARRRAASRIILENNNPVVHNNQTAWGSISVKKLVALAILGLVAASANAAGTYKLTKINSYNPFDPGGASVLIGPIPVAGVATVDGAGNVSASGISHSFVNVNFTYNYTGGVWSTTVGGTSITHTETCVEVSGVRPARTCRADLPDRSGTTRIRILAPHPTPPVARASPSAPVTATACPLRKFPVFH